MSSEKRGTKAMDHSHHISDYARRYALSPLKGLQKYFNDDMIPFAGGASVSPVTLTRGISPLCRRPQPRLLPLHLSICRRPPR